MRHLRLLERVILDQDGSVETNQLYSAYEFEQKEKGHFTSSNPHIFSQHILKIFPDAVRKLIKTKTKTVTLYKGISLKPINTSVETPSRLTDIKQHLPDDCQKHEDADKVTCALRSQWLSNGNRVDKIITFLTNGNWKLEISGKEVDLSDLFIDNKYLITKPSIDNVVYAANHVQLCQGLPVTSTIVVSRYHTVEWWGINGEKQVQRVRSVLCKRALPLYLSSTACKSCRLMTFKQSSKERSKNLQTMGKLIPKEMGTTPENKQTHVSKEDILKLIPGATTEMANLILSQTENVTRDPKGRRWNQNIITTCLQWFCKSPHSYEAIRDSKYLVLPSRSTLIAYKNKIKQNVGFEEENFQWMFEEAKRRELTEEGKTGGIIFDEMSIQSSIQIAKNGDLVELVGLTDMGKEGNACEILRQGKIEKSVGTHILQMVFLSITGFRFPFAHFITTGIQQPQIYTLFWEAVDRLRMFGFRAVYTCMDGAQSNRSFLKLNLGKNPTTFKQLSPCLFTNMVFMMDPSHLFKKIRNNILKSGFEKNSTRVLTLPSNYTIQWLMFKDCYQWDKTKAFQAHRKLTNSHFFPNNQEKMRNHLAEDVLDKEMLFLMKEYQRYLGDKGSVLNGVIELLQVTSTTISIFRDMKPIKLVQDPRLANLSDAARWFNQWKLHGEANAKKGNKPTIMSLQCHEDVQSCLIGFCELCETVLGKTGTPTTYITPGLVNSDVVENTFNQQRATYHGANANPTALQYRRALNNIVLCQNTVSVKANCGKSRSGALPYNCNRPTFSSHKPTKRKKDLPSENNIKVIRM